MTTRYDFVVVFINGENKGIYAIEEHFDLPMLDRNQCRKSVILKFDESPFWEFQKYLQENDEEIHFEYPLFEKAKITAFGMKAIKRSPELSAQFVEARDRLHALQLFKYEKLGELLNIEKFAKYYALCDIVQMYHGLNWHNQRFYFDPITKLLEPIAFDNWQPNSQLNRTFIGQEKKNTDTIYFPDVYFKEFMLNNNEFKQRYFIHLNEFLNESFLQLEINSIRNSSKKLVGVLKTEFDSIEQTQLLIDPIWDNSSTDNLNLKNKKEKPFTLYNYRDWKKDYPKQIKIYDNRFPLKPFKNLGLVAFIQSVNPGKNEIVLENRHVWPIEIIGFWGKHKFESRGIVIPEFSNDLTNELTLNIDTGFTKIKYRVVGDTVVYSTKISRWRLFQPVNFSDNRFIENENFKILDSTVFISGNCTIGEEIILPSDHKVEVEPGTTFDFINGGALVFQGDVVASGTVEMPIVFTGITNGIVFSQGELLLDHCLFQNLALTENSNLSGSVTVLDALLKMGHCSFNDIIAEDALNLVKSDLFLSNSSFKNCSSDALDLDFSERFKINSVVFDSIGNDGLDLSNSKGRVFGCRFTNIQDKAISVGESGVVNIRKTAIELAAVGVASKDGSRTFLFDCTFSECGVALWAFRKKQYYDGGFLKATNVLISNTPIEHQVDEFSVIESGN